MMSGDKPLFTAAEVAAVCGGELTGWKPGDAQPITSVSIDSRTVRPGALYVPIVGERFDGHDFIRAAKQAGAVLALSDRTPDAPGAFIRVADTLSALHDLAAWHRSRSRALVVGVTGSAGKTTTKEMVGAVLSQGGPAVRTDGNLNNETGVPQMIFRLEPETEYAVFEMGMNHFGEIDRLARIVQPDIGIITNIGTAHIEFLGSREGILQAKTEMVPHLQGIRTLLVNGDDDLLRGIRFPGVRVLTFGFSDGCDIQAREVQSEGLAGTRLRAAMAGEDFELHIPFPGRYLVYAALAAAGCGVLCGLSADEIARGAASYAPAGSRMRIIRTDSGLTVIDDTYNANLPAVKAALEVLGQADGARVAVLGEMRELGEASGKLHAQAVEAALSTGVRLLVAVGPEFETSARRAGATGRPVLWFNKQEELLERLTDIVRAGDTILVKGSRGMHMEDTVAELLRTHHQ